MQETVRSSWGLGFRVPFSCVPVFLGADVLAIGVSLGAVFSPGGRTRRILTDSLGVTEPLGTMGQVGQLGIVCTARCPDHVATWDRIYAPCIEHLHKAIGP